MGRRNRRWLDLPVLGKGCRSNSLIHAVYWWLLVIHAIPLRPHPYLAHNWKCSLQDVVCCAIASQFVCSCVVVARDVVVIEVVVIICVTSDLGPDWEMILLRCISQLDDSMSYDVGGMEGMDNSNKCDRA